MARLIDSACLGCVDSSQRLTEEYGTCEDAIARIADLSSKGTQHFFCHRSSYFVCFRGIPSAYGILPRYEGQRISGP